MCPFDEIAMALWPMLCGCCDSMWCYVKCHILKGVV